MAAEPLNRRSLLRRASAFAAAGGLGLYRQLSIAAAANAGHPLAPRPGHVPAKAKNLIVFFMTGGFSHLDTFDYKPKLQRDHDKTVGKHKVLASPYRVPPAGRVRQDGQRAVRARRRGRRRPLLPAHGPRRLGRPLGRDPGHAHRLGDDPAAEPRLVGQLRPRHAQHEPALVRRARGQGAVQRLPGLGLELPARLSQGGAGHPRPRPAPRREEPGGVGLAPRARGADAPRPERGPPLGPRRRRGPGVADGHVRHRLRPDARGPRGLRHRPRAPPHPGPLRRRGRTTPARSPPSAWSPAAWSSGGCGWSSCSTSARTRTGTATTTSTTTWPCRETSIGRSPPW